MKKISIILLLLLTPACASNTQSKVKTDTVTKKATGIQYTCPMHPSIISNKPGVCPKCGMQLVEKDDSE